MRPAILNPLFAPVTGLDGVGPKVATLLARLLDRPDDETPRVVDLLFHLPSAVIDRSRATEIAYAPEGSIVTMKVRVDRHAATPRGSRAPYRVFVHDETGEMALVFFGGNGPWLAKKLVPNAIVYVSGQVEWFNGRPQMVHPDYIVPEAELEDLPSFEPVYPMTQGLAKKTLVKSVSSALHGLPELPEWIGARRLSGGGWSDFATALRSAHRPAAVADLEPLAPARARLAYDELFADQLTLALTRAHMKRTAGRARIGDGSIAARVRAAFPYPLTGDQETAVGEIVADVAKPQRMLRLLQGDVGSGKTIVALLAMAAVVEAGSQAALMAPTEILARQHFATIGPLAAKAGLGIAILTGRETRREREVILDRLAAPKSPDGLFDENGGLDILIGTHALFQEGVAFRDLGLAVVDEQHRFGVQQRLALAAKGEATDVLVMTATPIPRSLVLTTFGDMDVSQLREKPAGRKPVATRVISDERLDEVVGRIGAAIAEGDKVFWVCPLVEESDESDLTAVATRAEMLREALGVEVALVHGRMSGPDKDREMERFRDGGVPLLVATTVIEVGVDVPDASIMVIEHAERFGLAQLHQLRGRVGRGDKPATCLLLYRPPLGETARARLEILRESDDGFRIAEEDLRLRGGGEILGTRQAGVPTFRLADLDKHQELMELAREDAVDAVTADPDLAGPRAEALRILLYLFGRDAAVRLLRAG
ncbi:MAG: ATP-dependent DNA helicase RecG [Bauldia sp.]|nr:ATP-dependent DNA helicase RecG [Bauldia sp.]